MIWIFFCKMRRIFRQNLVRWKLAKFWDSFRILNLQFSEFNFCKFWDLSDKMDCADLVKRFPTCIWSPRFVLMERRTDRSKFEIEDDEKWVSAWRIDFVGWRIKFVNMGRENESRNEVHQHPELVELRSEQKWPEDHEAETALIDKRSNLNET